MNLKSIFFSYFFKDFQRWPLWAPVFLGIGISLYFSLSFELPLWWIWGSLLFLLPIWGLRFLAARLILFILFFISLGFLAVVLRTHLLKTDMLQYPLKPIFLEGRVSQVELKPTKQGTFYQRVFLSDLRADTPEKLPQKIRLTLKGKKERLWPGQIIRIKAKLNPITEPSLPRSFDFRRQAYFNGMGATGFALSSPQILKFSPSWANQFEKRRAEITAFFLDHMPLPLGSLAASIITGDKSAIPDEVREDFIMQALLIFLPYRGFI